MRRSFGWKNTELSRAFLLEDRLKHLKLSLPFQKSNLCFLLFLFFSFLSSSPSSYPFFVGSPPPPSTFLAPFLLFFLSPPVFLGSPIFFFLPLKKNFHFHVLSTHVLMLKTWECGCVGGPYVPHFFDFFILFLIIK